MWAMMLKLRMWLRSLDFLASDITLNLKFVHRFVHRAESALFPPSVKMRAFYWRGRGFSIRNNLITM